MGTPRSGRGPDAGPAGRLPRATFQRLTRLLDAPDPVQALAELQALVAAEDAPDRIVAHLAKKVADPDDRLRRVVQEGARLPWPQLAEAAQADRLSAKMMAALIGHDDCTREFGKAVLGLQDKLDTIREPLHRNWRGNLLRTRLITPAELLEHSRRPIGYLGMIANDRRQTTELCAPEPCAEARALTDEFLGDGADAWVVVVRLMGDFSGTFRELLATAQAMTR